jgi:hypothetical protein
MPIPGLIDTYAFADWMKVEYRKAGRPQLLVTPENGGLLQVDFLPAPHRGRETEAIKVEFHKHKPRSRRHACPKGEYVFVEREEDQQVPPSHCPNHGTPLYQSEWIVGAEEEMP